MKHGSLFSGIGGFDLAAEWMGWENVFHCEWNEFGQRVLKHHFPKALSYADITETDFNVHRGRISVLSGGFPCQPYSSAGKRLGKEDERHLWPEMLRAIREIQPRWVVGENVLGLVNWNGGMVFEEVQADLEAQGYEVQPFILPAAAVNAPHRRDRVWFVAHSNKCNDGRTPRKDEGESGAQRVQERDAVRQFAQSGEVRGNATNSDNGSGSKDTIPARGKESDELYGLSQNAPDTDKERLYTSTANRELERERFRRVHQQGQHWQDFPTEPPICSRDDGFSDRLDGITFPKWRNESIKAYGNAIVPQVAHQIFKAIQEYEESLLH
jgi:DNA (cytosine-5)-methyltransferase 1